MSKKDRMYSKLCIDYAKLQSDNDRLKEKIQEIDHDRMNVLCEREQMRKALEEIASYDNTANNIQIAVDIALLAINKEIKNENNR
jgi:hypothetical protein